MGVLKAVFLLVRGVLKDRTELALENLALRQQLVVLERAVKPPYCEFEIESSGSCFPSFGRDGATALCSFGLRP
jgi:hypothetical protein